MTISAVLPWQVVPCVQDLHSTSQTIIQQYDSFARYSNSTVKDSVSANAKVAVENCYFATFDVLKVAVTEYTSNSEIWYQLSTGFIKDDLVSLTNVSLTIGDYLYLCFMNEINRELPLAGKSLAALLHSNQAEVKLSGYDGDERLPYGYFENMLRMSPTSDSEYYASAVSALLQTVVLSGKTDNEWTPELVEQLACLSRNWPSLLPDGLPDV